MFRTSFSRGSQRYFVDPGRGVRDKMSVVVDKKGFRHLEKVGETDFYEYIQSHKDSVDLKQIIERCVLTGDPTMLQRMQGTYGDYVGIPGDLRSLEHLKMFANDAYNALSDEIKAKLGFEEFLEGFSTPEKFESLQNVLNPSAPILNESEVIIDEPKQ